MPKKNIANKQRSTQTNKGVHALTAMLIGDINNTKGMLILFAFLFIPTLLLTLNLITPASASNIIYKGSQIEYNGSGKSLVIPAPTMKASGDVLIAQLTFSGGTNAVITAPSGWTLIRRDNNSTYVSSATYYHVVGTNEPASYIWTFTTLEAITGGVADFSGVNTSMPVDVTSGNTGTGAMMTAATVSTNTPIDMILFFGASNNVATINPPSGMTTNWRVSSTGNTSYFADGVSTVQGETGNKTATITKGTSTYTVSQLIALLPKTNAPTSTPAPLPTAIPKPTVIPTAIPTSLPVTTATPTTVVSVPTVVPTAVPTAIPTTGATATSMHIITTLYAYPTLSSWSQVESGAPTVNYAIADVCAPDGSGSGCNGNPADAQNTAWNPTITTLKNDGITPLYYISTNYGATALTTIESEIQNAITWYGTPSPMFDEMQPSGTCSNGGNPLACTTYYNDLYTYFVNAGATIVMFNAGTTYNVTTADMFGPKEVLQIFEGSASSFETSTFPSWMASYPANEFSATISDGTATTVSGDVQEAAKDNIGYFYEDDETEPPTYSTLPAFWSTEINDVASAK